MQEHFERAWRSMTDHRAIFKKRNLKNAAYAWKTTKCTSTLKIEHSQKMIKHTTVRHLLKVSKSSWNTMPSASKIPFGYKKQLQIIMVSNALGLENSFWLQKQQPTTNQQPANNMKKT